MLRDTVARFAADRIAPLAEKIDREDWFPRELWPEMGALGLHGITVSEEDGGAGLGYLEHCVAMEEISRASGSRRALLRRAFQSLREPDFSLGRPEQKARYLPKLISGEHLGALAMSEAGAGSDVVSMQLRAEKRGDRYVLNGTKFWITNGPQADTLVVYAKTDPGGRRARHHRLHRREGFSGLLGRAEARQARHARLGDGRARLRGLRGAGGERARQGRARGSRC